MRVDWIIGVTMTMVALATSTAGCASPADGLTRTRGVVAGENTLSIWNDAVTTRGVVVYFHGLDRDETILEMDEPHRELTRRLTDAGYVVVASRAGGNAYGNKESQDDYAELAVTAAAQHRVSDVFFLAESMGTVAAVNLMAKRPDLRPRGLAAIGPALNFGAVADDYRPSLLGANPDVSETDPMRLPVESLAGQRFRFYVSPDDVLVPTASNADAFRARFGSVADVSMIECSGEHLNSSCVNGGDVVSWFSAIAPW
ncbi:lysophospholipase [Gordonia rubripertincta]|uniref:alpha/beta hydrolase n=1 Tax=Gordonia rubripertincta TaxID=36822 RepID=UPI00117DF566|nr:alpha/beta hydrolase [Gordonia rubripertincta]TSD95445.1 lysophospholipase [Gordonia rubripertincta]